MRASRPWTAAACGRIWRRRTGDEAASRPPGADHVRQRGRGVDRRAGRLGPGRRHLAGLAGGADRRGAGRRSCSLLRRALGLYRPARAHGPGVARHAHRAGHRGRAPPGLRRRGRGGGGVAVHRPPHPAPGGPGRRAVPQPADRRAGIGCRGQERHPAAPVAGRGQPPQAVSRRHRAAARRPAQAVRPRPGPVRVLGRHHDRGHGAPLGKDHHARRPAHPVRARPGRRDQRPRGPVGRDQRAARRDRDGVGVRSRCG